MPLTNVTHKQDIEAAVGANRKRYRRRDVLINNAGIRAVIRLLSFPEQEWNDVIAVNRTGFFLVSSRPLRAVWWRVRQEKSDQHTMQSEPGRDTITPYAASKVP